MNKICCKSKHAGKTFKNIAQKGERTGKTYFFQGRSSFGYNGYRVGKKKYDGI